MDRGRLGLAILFVALCLGCISVLTSDDYVDGVPAYTPEDDSVCVGDNEHGMGYYRIEDNKEATFIGIWRLPGNNNDATFVVASYIIQSEMGCIASYGADVEGGQRIPVTKIYGSAVETGDDGTKITNQHLLRYDGIRYFDKPDDQDKPNQNTTTLKLIVPVTIREISGLKTLNIPRLVLVFDERTEGEPLSFGSNIFSVKYTRYTDGMHFPDNVTFMVDSFLIPSLKPKWVSGQIIDIYLGANTRFMPTTDGNSEIKYLSTSKIYSETNLVELLNGNIVGANFNFYQSAYAGIFDDTPDYLSGYYLKDMNYLIIDYAKHIKDDLDVFVIFDTKIRDKLNQTGTIIQKTGDQTTLSVSKKEAGVNLQIQYGNNKTREVDGVFDISNISRTTIINVNLTEWIVTCKLDQDAVFETVTVTDGEKFSLRNVPFIAGKEFAGWQLDGNDYNHDAPVKSDLTLSPKWVEGTVHLLTISSLSSSISVSAVGAEALNQYGMIKPNGSVKLSLPGTEKIEVRQWRVTIGGDSNPISISEPGTNGNITLSDNRRELTISSINTNVTVDLDAIYISESHAPTPVVSVDMPTNVSELMQKWVIGTGQTSNAQNMWAGGSSEPLILGNYAYVRLGASLFKIDTDNGDVVATAESGLTYAFFHNLGYLGNGYIVDYVTENVYDIDLKSAGFKVSGKVVFDDENKVAYSFTPKDDATGGSSAKISLYNPYTNTTENGYLKPVWIKDIEHELYFNQGGPSLPLILGDSVYWLSGERGTDGKTKIWISTTTLSSSSTVSAHEIKGLNGLLLDNGWTTTDGERIYVTSYGQGLLSTTSFGQGKVAVLSKDLSEEKALYLKGTSQTTSAMVFIDDLAFVKVGPDIFVYSKSSIINGANESMPDQIASIRTSSSHGSIVVSKGSSENEYYIYYAAYENGKIHIIKYDSVSKVFTDSIMDDLHTYCSQGIRVSQNGNMIYYDDTGRLYGYVPVQNNVYRFVIDDGTSKVLVESTGVDSASALSSSGYGSVSNGLLLGAKISKDLERFDETYSLYVSEYGVWKHINNKDMSSQEHGNVWLITKNNTAFPDSNTSLKVAGTETYRTLGYIVGNKIEVDSGNVRTQAPFASYKGMVVRINTNTTDDLTISTIPSDLEVKTHGSVLISENKSYSFVMPDQDVRFIIGEQPEQPNEYTVTFVNGNTTISSKKYAAGTPASSIEKPEDPTKAEDDQFIYTFSGWEPAIADVTNDVTYQATFTQVIRKYTVTFYDEDETTVLKSGMEYEYGTAASDIVKPADPTKASDNQFAYTFNGWTPELATVTGNATYKATYAKTPISSNAIMYSLSGSDSVVGSNKVIDLNITRTSGNSNISNARLLVIAMYESGFSVNVYSKVDLASDGSASEQVVVSKDKLVTVTVKMLEGIPASGQPFDSFGSYEYQTSTP